MAGSASDYLEEKLLNLWLGGVAWSPPASLWLAAFIGPPGDNNTGTADEVSSNGYARVEIPNDLTNWPVVGDGTKTNALTITFPTATGWWDLITHVGLYDAATGGNLLAWADLVTAKEPDTGDVLEFAPGELIITAG